MKKRALLVGINYADSGNALKGCLNDSEHMKALLESRGFTEIKSVLEKEATTAGIIAGLNWLVADAKPGDVIVFHYSGHGSQLPSTNEPDGWEEIICPIDLNWMDKVITDDTLRKIFDKVPNGVNITLILDCCHSGTMLDQSHSLLGTKEVKPTAKKPEKGSRYLKPPAKIVKQLANKEVVEWEASRDVNASALLIAGCHASQTSADAFIDGKYQGAASASLIASVSANPTISYRNLALEMGDYMKRNRFTQVPQLDGSESLYDQLFLEQFSFTIQETPVEEVVIPAKPEKKNDNKKNVAVVALVLAFIALIIYIVG